MKNLTGVTPIVPTPFSPDGAVDLPVLGCVVEFAVTGGRVPVVAGVNSADSNEMVSFAKDAGRRGVQGDAIQYIKEERVPSGSMVSAFWAGANGRIDGVISGGGAHYLFEELERGAGATRPAMGLLELHVAIMKACAAGRRSDALSNYERSLPLLLVQAPYRMRMTKLILRDLGLIETEIVRETQPKMDAPLKKLVLELYDRVAGEEKTVV